MRIKALMTVPTVELLDELDKATKAGDQDLINVYAYELTCRTWIPNDKMSFIDMLKDLGYVKHEKNNNKESGIQKVK